MSSSNEDSQKLAAFRSQRVLNLESYKKDGSPVRTPVVFAEKNGEIIFQTALKAWKAKRVIRNPIVRVVPSTFRGDPKGEWMNGKVRKLSGEEARAARLVYTKKLGFITSFFFLFERVRWGEIAFSPLPLMVLPRNGGDRANWNNHLKL